jgi:hypothetical protein
LDCSQQSIEIASRYVLRCGSNHARAKKRSSHRSTPQWAQLGPRWAIVQVGAEKHYNSARDMSLPEVDMRLRNVGTQVGKRQGEFD